MYSMGRVLPLPLRSLQNILIASLVPAGCTNVCPRLYIELLQQRRMACDITYAVRLSAASPAHQVAGHTVTFRSAPRTPPTPQENVRHGMEGPFAPSAFKPLILRWLPRWRPSTLLSERLF